jgi:hypothetical protein
VGAPRWGAPFIAARGGGMKAVQYRPWSRHRQRGLGANVPAVRLTSEPTWFQVFLNLSKTGSTFKIKMDDLFCFINSPYLYDASLEYCEQLFQL